MMREVLAVLAPNSFGVYIDGTLGGGSHAESILEASQPLGHLVGFDRDGDAIEAARGKLERFKGRFQLVRENFSKMDHYVKSESSDGVLLDLGVSSHQLDTPERGFGFNADGPLDMRMDCRSGRTAGDLLNSLSAEELARIFWENGGERDSRRIARTLVRERELRTIESTGQLASLVEKVCPRRGRKSHPATRVFQALRVEVNDEIGSLRHGLSAALRVLKPGGRLAIITFDSLQDRVTKDFFRAAARDYRVSGEVDDPLLRIPRRPDAKLLFSRAVEPGDDELEKNPRARSAQLRALEKLANGTQSKN